MTKDTILTALEDVRDMPKGFNTSGICWLTYNLTRNYDTWDWIFVNVGEWPECKEQSYPIEGNSFLHSNPDKWNPETERGKLRIELLNWLIERRKEEIGEGSNQ